MSFLVPLGLTISLLRVLLGNNGDVDKPLYKSAPPEGLTLSRGSTIHYKVEV